MKILFLAPQPFYVERGTPIAVRLAIEALCRSGHEVDLLTLHEGEDISIPGMRLIRIRRPPGVSKVPIGFSWKKAISDLWLAAVAMRLVRRGNYDVVHAVEEAVFIGLFCRLLRRFKLVYDMDSLLPDQIGAKWPAVRPLLPTLRWFEGQAVKRSDLVLAVCQHIADRAAVHKDRALIHWTPDVAFTGGTTSEPHESLRSYCRVPGEMALYVGNLESYQGVDLLLEALAALPAERRCNLIIIGGDSRGAVKYRELAERMGLGLHVSFVGQRPLAGLPAYLMQADILCSPRLGGVNTPMKIYSYLAAGKAILATDIPSHQQVLDDSCALLVEPSVAASASGLDRLIANPELRTRLGRAAAERAGKRFSITAFEQRIARAYRALAEEAMVATM